MGQFKVTIGGRSYPLACRDGEESRLAKLAAHVDAKSDELTGELGQMREARLLLMSAILIAEEYFEARDRSAGESEKVAAGEMVRAGERVEAVADVIEQQEIGRAQVRNHGTK